MISAADVAWVAGIMEGEGSFVMSNGYKNGVCYRYPRVIAGMTDQDVVARLASYFGTRELKRLVGEAAGE